MKVTEFKKLIREEVRKVLKEAYRKPDDNLDILIKLLKRKKVNEVVELLETVKEGLEFDDLATALDEAIENLLDDGGLD